MIAERRPTRPGSKSPPPRSSAEERWKGCVYNAEYLGLRVSFRTWLSAFWREHFNRVGGPDSFDEEIWKSEDEDKGSNEEEMVMDDYEEQNELTSRLAGI